MNTESEFPAEVLDAIHANRNIQAVKLLRESRGIGLKEAKELVDAYVGSNPNLQAHRRIETESGIGRVVLIGLILAVGYLAYRMLA